MHPTTHDFTFLLMTGLEAFFYPLIKEGLFIVCCHVHKAIWPMRRGDSLVSNFYLAVNALVLLTQANTLYFTRYLRCLSQVLMHTWQAFYPVSYLGA